ncbi:MAG: TlpA family protein disulfide reductase [Actinomycetia bacterium]|nr:TlpA family protein disulfide reductase [Actinomycetes bacterium]
MPTHSTNRTLVVAFVALTIVASACASATVDKPATLGNVGGIGAAELAPQFSVPTSSGEIFSLQEHLSDDGRPVFLNLWASWCFPCREEMPDIDAASKRFPEIMFIGVAVQDSRTESQKFLDEIQVSYLIGFDTDDIVDRAYSPIGLPATYIISSEGVILDRILGKLTEEQIAEEFAIHFG